MTDKYRQCDADHLRDYPGCYEECGYGKCVAGEPTSEATPMTDKTRETIADSLYEDMEPLRPSHARRWADDKAAFILAIPEIKEGQKLREKADRLVELSEDQSTPSKTIRNTPDPLTGGLDDFDRGGQDMAERMKTAGFRRVKVKG